MACPQCWASGSATGTLRCCDPVLPFDQGAVQAAAQADRRDGGQPLGYGRTGLARSRLLHPVPQAEDSVRSDPVSPRRRAAEPAGRQQWDQVLGRWRMANPETWPAGVVSDCFEPVSVWTKRDLLFGAKSAPLGESGGTVGLECVPAREAAFLVEMVLDGGMDGCELRMPLNRSIARSRRRNGR